MQLVAARFRFAGKTATNSDVVSQAEADEQILTFDIPDDVLERTANAEQTFTMMYCTHPWYNCGLPQ
jgi:hypothetical protein